MPRLPSLPLRWNRGPSRGLKSGAKGALCSGSVRPPLKRGSKRPSASGRSMARGGRRARSSWSLCGERELLSALRKLEYLKSCSVFEMSKEM